MPDQIATQTKKSKRIASIEWVRGLVMIVMVLDHVSMAYDIGHLSSYSAALFIAGSYLPDFAFLTRWMTHLCAPTFVFLAGTALVISGERRLKRGQPSWEIDEGILKGGLYCCFGSKRYLIFLVEIDIPSPLCHWGSP